MGLLTDYYGDLGKLVAAPERGRAQSALGMSSPQDQQFARRAKTAVEGTTGYQNLQHMLTTPIDQMADLYTILQGKGDTAAEDRIVGRVGEGLMGMGGTFAGTKAKNAPLGMLKKAEELKAAGVPDRQIWADTGWTSAFPDGKWRWEIPDNDAGFTRLQQGAKTGAFENYAEHDAAFNAYPTLKSIEYQRYADGNGGAYTPRVNYSDGTTGEVIRVNDAASKTGIKSTTLHELQHAVQDREGFASGGNVTEMTDPKTIPFPELRRLEGEIESIRNELAKSWDDGLARKLGELSGQHTRLTDIGAFEHYKRLAGEAESRLTQKRMDLTPEQRRAQYPIDQFDVPVDQQIVRGLLGGM